MEKPFLFTHTYFDQDACCKMREIIEKRDLPYETSDEQTRIFDILVGKKWWQLRPFEVFRYLSTLLLLCDASRAIIALIMMTICRVLYRKKHGKTGEPLFSQVKPRVFPGVFSMEPFSMTARRK